MSNFCKSYRRDIRFLMKKIASTLTFLFILFLGVFSFASNTYAAITDFTLSVKTITSGSASFDITATGENVTDIDPDGVTNYNLQIFSEYAQDTTRNAKYLFNKNTTTGSTSSYIQGNTLTVPNTVITGLREDEVYYAAVELMNSGVVIGYSNFLKFQTGTSSTAGSVLSNIETPTYSKENGERTIATIDSRYKENSTAPVKSFEINPVQIGENSVTFTISIGVDSTYQLEQSGEVISLDIFTVDPKTKDQLIDSENIASYQQVFPEIKREQTQTKEFTTGNNLVAGKTYYAVGTFGVEGLGGFTNVDRTGTVEFTMGKDGADGTFGQTTTREENQSLAARDIPECDLITGGLRGVAGCFSGLVDTILVGPTSYFAALSAEFLDFFIDYSISSESYSGVTNFIEKGWKIMRDFSNIVFIFVLVFTALSTTLNLGWFNTKQAIAEIILIAIVINFSLFFTRAVVDLGNITARVFYNAIEVTRNDTQNQTGKQKSLTLAVAQKIQPQTLLSADIFDVDTSLSYFILMQVIIVGVNILMIYLFLSIAFLFVGRTVGIMIAMIFSPFAFISRVLPKNLSGSMGVLGWSGWLGNLFQLTFMAPVFLFFMYLILQFLNVTATTKFVPGGSGSSPVAKLVTFFVPVAILVTLLLKAKDITTKMSGEIGAKINEYAGKATGLAIGAATGGAALLGSATLGRFASKSLRGTTGDKLRQNEAEGGFKGYASRLALKTLDSGATGSFDARKTKLGTVLNTKTGVPINQKSTITTGGYDGLRKKEEQERLTRAEALKTKLNDDDVFERVKVGYSQAFKEYRAKHPDIKDEDTEGLKKLKSDFKSSYINKEREKINKERIETYAQTIQRQAVPSSIISGRLGAGIEGSISAGKKLEKNPLTAALGDEIERIDKKILADEENKKKITSKIKEYGARLTGHKNDVQTYKEEYITYYNANKQVGEIDKNITDLQNISEKELQSILTTLAENKKDFASKASLEAKRLEQLYTQTGNPQALLNYQQALAKAQKAEKEAESREKILEKINALEEKKIKEEAKRDRLEDSIYRAQNRKEDIESKKNSKE